MGKYQFGKETLKMYGVQNLLDYKSNPALQEEVFLMNVMRNKWILRREISWYSDRYLAIDQGPIILMIENYRTQLLWNLFMQDQEIIEGLNNLGFIF